MGSQPPSHPVAHDCATCPAPYGEGDPRGVGWVARQVGDGQGPATPPSGSAQCDEKLPAFDSPDQADSRARPLSLRDFRMARPARVDIRFRKPCFFARLRLLGWNVRFTHRLLGAASCGGLGREGRAVRVSPASPLAQWVIVGHCYQ